MLSDGRIIKLTSPVVAQCIVGHPERARFRDRASLLLKFTHLELEFEIQMQLKCIVLHLILL